MEDLIGEIDELDPEDDKWLAKVKKVHESLQHHIQEEEGEIFPRSARCGMRHGSLRPGRRMMDMKAEKADAA